MATAVMDKPSLLLEATGDLTEDATMTETERRTSWAIMAVLAVMLMGIMAGCSRDADRNKYRTVEGRIISVDAETGVISMSFYAKRQGTEIPISGKLAPEGEVLIDGVTARLEDLQPGDQVSVRGLEEKREGEEQFVATRIEVSRRGTTQPGE